MSGASNIEWTDATWNPIVGCTIVSPGCTNCYAMKMAHRIQSMANGAASGHAGHYFGTTKKVNGNAVWTGMVTAAPDHILNAPLSWRKPKRIFVNSMGDLFHEAIPDAEIDKVFAVMALCPQHTFQVLTKRAERMFKYLVGSHRSNWASVITKFICEGTIKTDYEAAKATAAIWETPALPNVWLGVSAERQQEADERIPLLLQTPAAVRFVSAEPLLGPIDLIGTLARYQDTPRRRCAVPLGRQLIDWVIVGGESGTGARPMEERWAINLRDQCAAAGISFFFKQWGAFAPDESTRRTLHKAMIRIGKKAAGRLLDGRTHDEFPQVTA